MSSDAQLFVIGSQKLSICNLRTMSNVWFETINNINTVLYIIIFAMELNNLQIERENII